MFQCCYYIAPLAPATKVDMNRCLPTPFKKEVLINLFPKGNRKFTLRLLTIGESDWLKALLPYTPIKTNTAYAPIPMEWLWLHLNPVNINFIRMHWIIPK